METSLLKSLRPDAVYDKIYVISGNTNLSHLVRNLSRGLEARVTMLSLIGGDRTWQDDPDKMTLEVGVRFDPNLHWKPSTLWLTVTQLQSSVSSGEKEVSCGDSRMES